MMKQLSKKLLTPVVLLFSYCLVSSAVAQDNQAVQGNIIHQISATTEEGAAVVSVKGVFNPDKLGGVIKVSRGENQKFTVTLPNTLIDPEKITEPYMEFSEKTPLRNVQILENIKEKGEDVVFIVELAFEGRKDVSPKLVVPITSSEIKIKLMDPPDDMRNNAGQARAMAAEEKKQDDAARQRTEEMVKQTADEIIRHYRRPSLMQISIINASGWPKRAYQLSVFLGKLKKQYIEENLGIKVSIVNISTAKNVLHPQSTIYYKENYLKSALFIANIIEGEQKVVPMRPEKERMGVDIEIFLGKDFK